MEEQKVKQNSCIRGNIDTILHLFRLYYQYIDIHRRLDHKYRILLMDFPHNYEYRNILGVTLMVILVVLMVMMELRVKGRIRVHLVLYTMFYQRVQSL